MTTVHHMAGRLRLKFPELKNRPKLGTAVEQAIRGLPTVQLVMVNTVTGSLLIHYAARGAQQTLLLESIRDLLGTRFGLMFPTCMPAKAAAPGSTFHDNPIAGRVADMIIEKIVEGSAWALLGALI